MLFHVSSESQTEESKVALSWRSCIHVQKCKLAARVLDYTRQVQNIRLEQQGPHFTRQCVLRTLGLAEKLEHPEGNRASKIHGKT